MVTAFQPNAFQNNAFQIDASAGNFPLIWSWKKRRYKKYGYRR